MNFPMDIEMVAAPRPAPARGSPRLHRIIGPLLAVALATLLTGCSVMKIFYNQAPDFAYWYLDGHFDFTDAQSLQVKDSLRALHAWHRETQLPAYVDTLQKMQEQVAGDVQADAACAAFADIRRKLIALSDQAQPAVVALAPTLSAAQLAHLERRFAKGNADFREDFLEGSMPEQRRKRFKVAVSRAEMLYGSLEAKQLAVIDKLVAQSAFDAQVSYAERLRRQRDAVQTLAALAPGAPTAKVQETMRALFERSLNSPNPAFRSYFDKLTLDGCRGLAELHNSTTAQQRNHAAGKLRSYEQDFRTLSAQKS